MPTADQMALRLLLDGHKPGSTPFRELRRQVDVALGLQCPFCGSARVERADDSRLCLACTEQWDGTFTP